MPPILHFSNPHDTRRLPLETTFALPGDPLAEGRQFHVHDPQLGYAAGSASALDTDLRIDAYPWVELSLIEVGTLHVQGEGFELSLGPGEALVMPRGARLRWRHEGELRRLFMAFDGRASQGPMPAQPLKIDPDGELAPSSPPAASVLLSDTPSAHSRTLFESGGLRIGIWRCTPYARRLVEPAYCELMYFYAGAVAFATPAGAHYQVRAGEAILIPAGASNAWRSEVAVKKLFCILS